jgi:AhpD family alkylhydroperoxidase
VTEVRLHFYQTTVGAEFSAQVHAAAAVVVGSSLPRSTQQLIRIRASQINDSGFCVDIHLKDAIRVGETVSRLNLIAAWRDSTVFTDAERVALELTEQGTRLAGISDEVWAEVCRCYDEDQRAALIAQIALINTFNRMNVITNQPVGDRELVRLHEKSRPVGMD